MFNQWIYFMPTDSQDYQRRIEMARTAIVKETYRFPTIVAVTSTLYKEMHEAYLAKAPSLLRMASMVGHVPTYYLGMKVELLDTVHNPDQFRVYLAMEDYLKENTSK